jgi:GT2 family glycosyltransferase/tetratricopeptide (TPR) repeat protein
MPSRYLFGPITREFAERYLSPLRASGECLAFNDGGDLDLRIRHGDPWEAVTAQLPPDWRPDFAVLYLPYTTVPSCLWSAPLSLVALAPDANFLWTHYRRCLPRTDLVLADAPTVEKLALASISHAQPAVLFGLGQDFLDFPWPDAERDIDCLFIGNLSPSVQRGRLPFLGRLARLGRRRRVLIHTGAFGDDYRALLARSRIVFNRSVRGEANLRAFEATCAGALLVQERGNRETAAIFRDREEAVFYADEDLEELLHYYLDHEDERRHIAEAGRQRARSCTFLAFWSDALACIREAWPRMNEHAHERLANAPSPSLLDRWPTIGLAGPLTNYATAPQHVRADYSDLSGLDAFALRRKEEFAGQGLFVPRLTGFCLVARHDVIDKIGGFDERYGLGFFDDDDLCVRAREAGYRLAVARDVFIHHFGSRTFAHLGVDTERQLLDNFALFKGKHGDERAAGYRLPEAASRCREPSGTGLMPGDPQGVPPVRLGSPDLLSGREPITEHVSLFMIVKNEEANLPACLESVRGLFPDIVILDTGSTDRTIEVARSFGARVYECRWPDSFAAARNESMRHARGNWLFWLDADDRVDEVNRGKLQALLDSLGDEDVAYVMNCHCLSRAPGGTGTVVDHVRLFRNRPEHRWEHRIHEQILPALKRTGTAIRWSDVTITHVGYVDAAVLARKRQRDLRLLRLEEQEMPDHPFTLFNLGMTLLDAGKPEEALPYLRRSLRDSSPSDSIVRKLYALITDCHRNLGQPKEALAACQEGQRVCPNDAELLFVEGGLREGMGDDAGAEGCWRRLLGTKVERHFGSVGTGLRGFQTRHRLALLCLRQGRYAEAESLWQEALAEAPGWRPALAGLGGLYLLQERWPDAERVAGLLQEAGDHAEAKLLRARAHLGQKEFELARALLAELIAQEPRAVFPRLILSHAYLQEGKDWDAAERALRDVLALDPDCAEARQNLLILLQRQRRFDGLT